MSKFPFKSALYLLSAALLSACSLVKYQPLSGIDTVETCNAATALKPAGFSTTTKTIRLLC
jgi:putative patatin